MTQSDFISVSMNDWNALAEKALKGAPLASLSATIDHGIALPPLHAPSSTARPIQFGRQKCRYLERIDGQDIDLASAQINTAFEDGADGITLVFNNAPNAIGGGLPPKAETLVTLLKDQDFSRRHLRIDVHPHIRNSTNWLISAFEELQLEPKGISVAIGMDHAAMLASSGGLNMTLEALEASMPPWMAGFFAMGVPGAKLEADARWVHNAGGSIAQELGYALSRAVQHLRMMDASRQPLVYSAAAIGFALSADQAFFPTIAKFRAMRLLWQRVLEDCKIRPMATEIHAETSLRMLTAQDPESNILRNTIAAAGSFLGGANTQAIASHLLRVQASDAHARRIARNTHLILSQESHLDFPVDASAGSGSLEAITAAFCREGWEVFQQIEAEGGPFSSLRDGKFQSRIRESIDARQAHFRDGRGTIIGVTKHQTNSEHIAAPAPSERIPAPAGTVTRCEPLAPLFDDDFAEGLS